MHEYSIAYDIYSTARRAALENQAAQVTCVHVDFGAMAMVNPEQVKFLFDVIIEEDPLFTGARLDCRDVETRSRCPCGYEGNERFVCPECGKLPEIVDGREVVVTNIEIEVAD
ncbi:hydrogenase maturation nickel metallochaperone HypA [Methanoculleus sp. FWC-SCC1]|uniref:Hydrogenase maturation factor HypA n=1 Tax=Methanoculleus frigidifontis TaxID=2584085 RepID=A0ABT8M6D8_9EURY|nr:hydrogenase maturation nickel metallochaperone HypA [Methanoculleus sp. FWC-SCC1]MDN7023504.1 hydrogenase maturation nickel metallochaperone HypA [Methanoculleus sp. FWC-SCC1]